MSCMEEREVASGAHKITIFWGMTAKGDVEVAVDARKGSSLSLIIIIILINNRVDPLDKVYQ